MVPVVVSNVAIVPIPDATISDTVSLVEERTSVLLILYVFPVARLICSEEPKLSPVASNWKVLLPSPELTVIPAPSAAASLAAPSATWIFRSLTVTVVELIIVWVPSTWRSPLITTVPVLSPTPAGSIFKVAGPEIVSEETLIADPSAPVWNAVAVTIPEILTSSSSVCPSTSRSTPTESVEPLKVRLASSSSSPPVPAITTRLSVRSSTLNVFAWPPALISSKPPVVVIPETSTLSKLVCPSTSKSPLASMLPVNTVVCVLLILNASLLSV